MRKLQLCALYLLLSLAAVGITMAADAPHCGAYYVLPPTQAFEPMALVLPNTSPFNQVGGPRLVVETLGSTNAVKWQGMACDEVWLPAGSTIDVHVPDTDSWKDYKFLEQFKWVVGQTGELTWGYK